LLVHIANGLGGWIRQTEDKPHGRFAATIKMSGWYKAVDISVMPTETGNGVQADFRIPNVPHIELVKQ
jgi:hypothetical protein